MRSIQLSPVYIRIGRPGCSTNRTTSPTTPPPVGATKRKRPPPSGSSVIGLSTFAPFGVMSTSRWLSRITCESPPRPRYRPAKRAHAGSHATTAGFGADAFATAFPTVRHQLPRDVERIGVVRVREDDDADFVVELDERLRGIAGIAAAVPDVGPVVDATDVEAEARARGPVLFHRAHTVHLAQRPGAHDAVAAARAAAELRRDELRHVLDVRRDAGGRRHAARVDEGKHLARSVRHAASVRHGEARNVLVHARRGHAERLEDVSIDVVGPPSRR